ncbi:MAG: tRNA threonylcarbamoyladenosine dehydratase [Peptoniphilus sp.]|nr:tRNA threonylcarbamoyladenosine dehydratase [Peptoniphilus sp.]MDD7363106.1 tRNA threonylcarbamoyladenosine dehydratase [Bacillota bacterium]MDY6044372.1 tRNA threonylcarbamoyladenosine dehydratase [Peptoniphilus sp.]
MDPFLRTRWLIGSDALGRLREKRVAVFGIGGVGGHCAEALVRAGIGEIDVVDFDEVDITNINRQLIATRETVGRMKVEVMEERLLSIDPSARVRTYAVRVDEDTAGMFDFTAYDYVVDALDQVSAKLLLAKSAEEASVPFISAMGAGNKLHPEALEIAMLSETSVCPLAKVMRRETKRRGISDYPVVYSKEVPHKAEARDVRTPASISFVPPASGLLIASKVVRDFIEERS